MKYHFICFLDYRIEGAIDIKDCYREKEEALNNLERIAIDYVKELQGKQQAEKCKTDKTPEELLVDVTCKEGLYITTVNNTVILYEKTNNILPGRLFGYSSDLKVNKIGLFTISEYNFDDSIFRNKQQNSIAINPISNKKPSSNEKLTFHQKSNKEEVVDENVIVNNGDVLEELKKIMLVGFKLKSVPKTNVHVSQFELPSLLEDEVKQQVNQATEVIQEVIQVKIEQEQEPIVTCE